MLLRMCVFKSAISVIGLRSYFHLKKLQRMYLPNLVVEMLLITEFLTTSEQIPRSNDGNVDEFLVVEI